MMNTAEKRFNSLVTGVLPIAFIGAIYLNCIVFVLGQQENNVFRQIFVYGIQGIVAVVLMAKCILLWKNNQKLRVPILIAALILVVFGAIHIWAALIWHGNTLVIKNAVINGGYLLISLCGFIIIAAEDRLKSFLQTCRIYAVVLAPLIIYYCVRFYMHPNRAYIENLGVISYMPLAYMLLAFCIFLSAELIFFPPVRFKWMSYLLYVLFTIAIALSETKGTILCLMIGAGSLLVYSLLKKLEIKSAVSLFLTCVCCLILFSTVLVPGGVANSRVVAMFKELGSESAVNITGEDVQKVDNIIQNATETPETPDVSSGQETEPPDASNTTTPEKPEKDPNAGKQPSMLDFYESGEADRALAEGSITQEEYDYIAELWRQMYQTNTAGRMWLWSQAILEIKKAPLVGQGPLFYQVKYDTHPHNIVLEMATDFGVPLTLLVAALGIFVFFRMIRISLQDKRVATFFLYVLSFLAQAMVSGSLYDCAVFFQYGICILIALLVYKKLDIKFNKQAE